MKSQKKKVLRSKKYRKIKFKPKNTRIKNIRRFKKKRHVNGAIKGGMRMGWKGYYQ